LYGHERIAIKKKTTFLPPISFKNFLTGDLLSYLIQDEVNPLIFVHYDELKPITVGLFYFVGDEYTYWNRMSAAGIYAVIPSLLFFLLAQKYIVRGRKKGDSYVGWNSDKGVERRSRLRNDGTPGTGPGCDHVGGQGRL
jgi:hypothetical protein